MPLEDYDRTELYCTICTEQATMGYKRQDSPKYIFVCLSCMHRAVLVNCNPGDATLPLASAIHFNELVDKNLADKL